MKQVRIGNGCGFWGDNLDAPIQLVEKGQLDYLTLEYLAELTMSILAIQKQKNPQRGFAHDFLKTLERLTPHLQQQPDLKIVTNAGGMNPEACAQSARAILDDANLRDRKVAIVQGDDIYPHLDSLVSQGHEMRHLDTGEPLTTVRDRVVSANVYLGSDPIVEALSKGASIVITGRVADASLTLAPAMHELGWRGDDWNRLGAGIVAGHLIECGAQVTGGLWCNWSEQTNLAEVGYPIAVVSEDGTVEITKAPETGGVVNRETVIEQLLYEVGDPSRYLTPDVVADFTSVQIDEVEKDRARITNATGKPATDSYKASIAYRDGFMTSGTLVIFGPNAVDKARNCGAIERRRLERIDMLPQRFHVEVLGAGAGAPIDEEMDLREVVLRIAVRDANQEKVERFTRELAPLVTSGPPGISGYATGRSSVREVFAFWPALLSKDAIQSEVKIIGED